MNRTVEEMSATPSSGSVINSALWAALGDALGWITELARDRREIHRRIGLDCVSTPVNWRKTIGGWAGVEVHLPAGTYSDDTQLRLAVSRSIRGDGTFDPEAFAKIELPVWLSYSLGAGLGSKAAAANLSRKGVNWFSNFYDYKEQRYVNGGGNGAAMRIQPHVWASKAANRDKCLLDVLRNSLITHGHPHGFCGAFFHALALSDTFTEGAVLSANAWRTYVEAFTEVPDRIMEDQQLRSFWLEAWERQSGCSLTTGVLRARDDAMRDIDAIEIVIERGRGNTYREILEVTGCFEQRFRGSGLKTAIAASALSWIRRGDSVELALADASNELGSDTDTIATMAGAILGVHAPCPQWKVQDHDYIVSESSRLELIRHGSTAPTFHYPDLITWKPPTRQSVAVGRYEDGFALAGLGPVKPIGPEIGEGEDVWQWMEMPFGQSIIAKRKAVVRSSIKRDQLPGFSAVSSKPSIEDIAIQNTTAKTRKNKPTDQASLPLLEPVEEFAASDGTKTRSRRVTLSVDELTNRVIAANFDSQVIGQAFNDCLDDSNSIESAIAFAAIIAKAKLVRKRRGR